MSTYTPTVSAWEAAMNPVVSAGDGFNKTYFGKVEVSVSFVALIKGQGRVPWEPNQVTPEGKPTRQNTGIDLHLVCTNKDGQEYSVDRNMIAEFGEWPDLVLPNLKEIGVMSLQELHGKFVQAELVPTGETYVNKAGETKEKTTFKFIKVFADKASMEAARTALFAGDHAAAAAVPSVPPAQAQGGNGNGNGASVNPEKATAERFLDAYVQNAWRSSGKDLTKAMELLGPMIAGQALLAKYFTVDSPEVMKRLEMISLPF